jgi:hypothetical protein
VRGRSYGVTVAKDGNLFKFPNYTNFYQVCEN